MRIDIIQDRLDQYKCKNILEEENAIKEITQEIALLALSRAGFFKIAEFHGGTALRIFYKLPRFSEDLDFALLQPNHEIKLLPFLNKIADEFSAYGYDIEIDDRSKDETTIKKAFLKDDSIGKVLSLRYPVLNGVRKKIKIKVEVDSNPPAGAAVITKYLDFPQAFSIQCKDLASSFAGKCHALLCRAYIKGRDWYDFVWYMARNAEVNYVLLQNALMQQGPWQGKIIDCNAGWLRNQLLDKIESISWEGAANDVAPFLSENEQRGLEVWSKDFFISRADKLLEA